MNRNYASRSRSSARGSKPRAQTTRRKPARSKNNSGGMFWFISGAAVGALATALILVPGLRPELPVVTEQQSQAENPAPQYEFYDLLSEDEVVVQDESPIAEKPVSRPGAATPPTDATVYLVQAGSFRRADDADARRMQLLLMNFQDVSVKKAQTDAGESLYRVMVGPFTDPRTMTAARNKMAANNIETLPLKRKQ